MTVSSTSPLIVYDYTGAGVYTFPFRIFEDTDLVITHDTDDGQSTLLINQVDYLVGIIEEIEGGNVEITNTVITGGTLEIRRQLPVTQEVDWVNNDPLDAEILEISFDRIIMILQEFYDRIDSIFVNFSFQGTWTPNTYYDQYNIVLWEQIWWVSKQDFTSGDVFDEDNWNPMFDFTSLYDLLEQACECATQACECATQTAEDAQNTEALRDQAAASEANAAISETHSANCAKSAFDDAERAEDAADRAENIIGIGDRVDAIDQDHYKATQGQTIFTVTQPTQVGNLLVFMNSRKLTYQEDFTVNDELVASQVIIDNPAPDSGDEIEIVSFNTFDISGDETRFYTENMTLVVGPDAGADYATLESAFAYIATRYPAGNIAGGWGGRKLPMITISLQAGTHVLTGHENSVLRLYGFLGQLTILGQGSATTIVDGDTNGVSVQFTSCDKVAMDDFEFRGDMRFTHGSVGRLGAWVNNNDFVWNSPIDGNGRGLRVWHNSQVECGSAGKLMQFDSLDISGSPNFYGQEPSVGQASIYGSTSGFIKLDVVNKLTMGSMAELGMNHFEHLKVGALLLRSGSHLDLYRTGVFTASEILVDSNSSIAMGLLGDPGPAVTIDATTEVPVSKVVVQDGGTLSFKNAASIDVTAVEDAFFANNGGRIDLGPNTTINDVPAGKFGLRAENGGEIYADSPTITLNGGTANNIDPGVRQPDGSIIFDGTAIPSLPAEFLTADVTKTVGAGQDFETLWEAFEYLASVRWPVGPVPTANDGGSDLAKVTLSLTAGSHLFTGAPADQIRLAGFKGRLDIVGQGSGVTSIDNNKAGYDIGFRFRECGTVRFKNLSYNTGLVVHSCPRLELDSDIIISANLCYFSASFNSRVSTYTSGIELDDVTAYSGSDVFLNAAGGLLKVGRLATDRGSIGILNTNGTVTLGSIYAASAGTVMLTNSVNMNLVLDFTISPYTSVPMLFSKDQSDIIIEANNLTLGHDPTKVLNVVEAIRATMKIQAAGTFDVTGVNATKSAFFAGPEAEIFLDKRPTITGDVGFTDYATPPGVRQADGSIIYDGETLDPMNTHFLTESITKTVGTGQDFEELMDALKWASTQVAAGRDLTQGGGPTDSLVEITLDLTAQTHFITGASWPGDGIAGVNDCRLRIKGAGAGSTIIDSQATPFRIMYVNRLHITDLTIQGSLNVNEVGRLEMANAPIINSVAGDASIQLFYIPTCTIGAGCTIVTDEIYTRSCSIDAYEGWTANNVYLNNGSKIAGPDNAAKPFISNGLFQVARWSSVVSFHIQVAGLVDMQEFSRVEVTGAMQAGAIEMDEGATLAGRGTAEIIVDAAASGRDAVLAQGANNLQIPKLTITGVKTDKYGIKCINGSMVKCGEVSITLDPTTPGEEYNIPVASPQPDGSVIYDGSPTPIFISESMSKTIDPGGGGDFLTVEECANWLSRIKILDFDLTPRGQTKNIPLIEVHLVAGTHVVRDSSPTSDGYNLYMSCEARVFFIGAGVGVTTLGGNPLDLDFASFNKHTTGFFSMTVDTGLHFYEHTYVMLHGGYGGFTAVDFKNASGKTRILVKNCHEVRLASPGPNTFGVDNYFQNSDVSFWDAWDNGGKGLSMVDCRIGFSDGLTNVAILALIGCDDTQLSSGTSTISVATFQQTGGCSHIAGSIVTTGNLLAEGGAILAANGAAGTWTIGGKLTAKEGSRVTSLGTLNVTGAVEALDDSQISYNGATATIGSTNLIPGSGPAEDGAAIYDGSKTPIFISDHVELRVGPSEEYTNIEAALVQASRYIPASVTKSQSGDNQITPWVTIFLVNGTHVVENLIDPAAFRVQLANAQCWIHFRGESVAGTIVDASEKQLSFMHMDRCFVSNLTWMGELNFEEISRVNVKAGWSGLYEKPKAIVSTGTKKTICNAAGCGAMITDLDATSVIDRVSANKTAMYELTSIGTCREFNITFGTVLSVYGAVTPDDFKVSSNFVVAFAAIAANTKVDFIGCNVRMGSYGITAPTLNVINSSVESTGVVQVNGNATFEKNAKGSFGTLNVTGSLNATKNSSVEYAAGTVAVTNVPVAQIQYDGSAIYDGATPVTLKP